MIGRFRQLTDRIARDRDLILDHGLLRPVAAQLRHPSLWHVSRRSAMRAVPLGLLIAFMIPLGQVIVAALAALYFRAHIPIAAATTFVTNPLTLPFIYFAAYQIGALLIPGVAAWPAGGVLSLSAMGGLVWPIILGFVVMGLVSAALGYALSALWWRSRLATRWQRRRGRALTA